MARPKKDVKVRKDGLYPKQAEALLNEADSRGVSYAYILREAVDWYLSAKEQARTGSIATAVDDNKHEELVTKATKKSNNKKGK